VASLWSSCLLCAACTAPIGGNLVDRVGPRRVLVAVFIPFCMAVAALGLVQNAPQLFCAIFIVRALGPGWINIAFNKIFNGWWEKKRGRAASLLGVFHNCALLFVPATRAVINAIGWRKAYGMFALICFWVLAVVLLNVRDRADLLGLQPDGRSSRLPVSDLSKPASNKLPACHRVFCKACRTVFFPVYLVVSFTMEVAWGGLNFHINEIFAEAGLDGGDVAISYTVMTFAGMITGLVVGNFVVDRMQRKSLCVAFATLASGSASALLVVSIDGVVARWVTVIGFGVSLGMMSGFWEICYGILLADVFGLEILGTITGTLSTFGLSAHPTPVALSF
jgi:MFS family permease